MIKRFFELEDSVIFTAAIIFCFAAGLIDFLTGFYVDVTPLYYLPVFIVAWRTRLINAIIISGIAALIWFWAKDATKPSGVYETSLFWNAMMRFSIGLMVTFLTRYLKISLEEAVLARKDYLTGASNSRGLEEFFELELRKAKRSGQPMTISILDLDNFKKVNDTAGHTAGDKLLRNISHSIQKTIRDIDMLARIGGDEFVVFLPETDSDKAQKVLSRAKTQLESVIPKVSDVVTLSMGVVTFKTPPDSLETALKKADEIMYSVKHSGKNRIEYITIE